MIENIKSGDFNFEQNCGNCMHSSLEILENDKIVCDKDNSLQLFDIKKEYYEG